MDLALDLERGVQVDVAGVGPEIGDLLGETSPSAACASARATQTARHNFRRVSSENSERSSARPYLQENGDTYCV